MSAPMNRSSYYTIPKPCNHLIDFKLNHGFDPYNTFQHYLVPKPNGKTTVSLMKLKEQDGFQMMVRCNFCVVMKNRGSSRFYVCLVCFMISCSNHLILHVESESNKKNGVVHHNHHAIAVDVETAELYCCVCCDQVYDPDFDTIVMSKHMFNVSKSKKNVDQIRDLRSSKRRKLGLLLGGGGTTTELWLGSKNLSSKQLVSVRDQRAKSCFPLGLRGLNNLGNTCFMNSVLQALLHAPPLRNYFLGDKHSHVNCWKRSSDRLCLPCDIDVIFSAVFSGNRTPYSPAQFLYSWWQHSANLATYEQQDAHEFFISMLDLIHEEGKATNPTTKDNGDCQCIAHRVFSGLLRSDVTCMTCGFTSTTYDPCVDISLDLNSADLGSIKTKPSENTNPSTSTLLGCLDLFTSPEELGLDQKLFCQNCQERRSSLKQMSIRRLPLVLCLHIKRFEHSPTRKISRKIDRYLQFPFSLDMSPYLSSSIVRKRYGNRIFSLDDDESDNSTEFEIFAVVTHSGMLESGHYVTYLRLRNQWYRCDDAWINDVDEEAVRASQCYLLYYVQKGHNHKSSDDLSCLPISPCHDSFLPIAGCC